MNFALIGCGNMADIYAKKIFSSDTMRLAAVFHREQEKAERFARPYEAKAYSNYQEMLGNPEVEAVIVTVPTFLHKEFVLEAARHKKHVLCEKPLALNSSDAREMSRACEENGVRLYVAQVVRFFPEYAAIRQAVSKGQVGQPRYVRAKRLTHNPSVGSWYADTTKSGGVVLDLMIHDLDFLQWTFGPAKLREARQTKNDKLHHVVVELELRNGLRAEVESMWGYTGPFTTSIVVSGAKGELRHDSTSGSEGEEGVEVPEFHEGEDPYLQQIEHFKQGVEQQQPFIVDPEEVIQTMELVERVTTFLQTRS
ncbi:Gfo/Idh/MocA family protein [Paenibacillus senegalensis]|uniref:Gfo/Idh/MocA family protein n=1 Tax=Paenibacillus senegalensis TaxID=1465766 RepID=UPI000288473E|nr:Gfo/Idh/MocA family oxidoreductase [Paenibacillus senegalensis]